MITSLDQIGINVQISNSIITNISLLPKEDIAGLGGQIDGISVVSTPIFFVECENFDLSDV